jgi:hypothetical protein
MLRETLETPAAAACAGIGLKTQPSASALQHTVGRLRPLSTVASKDKGAGGIVLQEAAANRNIGHTCVAMCRHYAIV